MEHKIQIVRVVLYVALILISLRKLGLVDSTSEVKLTKTDNCCQREKTFNVTQDDIVRVIAPSSKTDYTSLPKIRAYIESLGLVANITENIYSADDPFYSNNDEFRANDLISALVDENVKVIWCIRGGAGSIRLVPYLEAKLPATLEHKIFIGYSDITVLHLYLQYKYGWQTIQGPMLHAIAEGSYPSDSESVLLIKELIFEQKEKVCWEATKLNDRIATQIESKVVGGNVALVETSIGTLWEIKTKGRILLLEEVGETASSIERSLDHMKQSGIFDGVDAVIFADFVAFTDNDTNLLRNVVFPKFVSSVSFPVFRVTGIGHGTVNKALPFLTNSEIKHSEELVYEFCVDNIQKTANDDDDNYDANHGGNHDDNDEENDEDNDDEIDDHNDDDNENDNDYGNGNSVYPTKIFFIPLVMVSMASVF